MKLRLRRSRSSEELVHAFNNEEGTMGLDGAAAAPQDPDINLDGIDSWQTLLRGKMAMRDTIHVDGGFCPEGIELANDPGKPGKLRPRLGALVGKTAD